MIIEWVRLVYGLFTLNYKDIISLLLLVITIIIIINCKCLDNNNIDN